MWTPLLLVVALVGVCSGTTQRVLFIGDSHTSTNSLNEMYKKVAESLLPDTTVTTQIFARDRWTLQQQFEDRSVSDAVAAGGYDVLVLQEEGSFGALNSRLALKYAVFPKDEPNDKHRRSTFAISCEWLAPAVKKHNVTVVYFQTWGFLRRTGGHHLLSFFDTFQDMQRVLSETYAVMDDSLRRMCGVAEEHSRIAPAGEAFEAVYNADVGRGVSAPEKNQSSLFNRLYATAVGKPSLLGTFVAAHTLFATINSRRRGEWEPPTVSYIPQGVSTADAMELILHSWDTAAPVSPQLRRVQGLFMKAPQWDLYVLRGRKLVKAEALPGETVSEVEIDDSGVVPRAKINGVLVDLQEEGGRDRLVIGDDYYVAFYEDGTTTVPLYHACVGGCFLHQRKETCATNPCCIWYRGKCARPCTRYQPTCVGECAVANDVSGTMCVAVPWDSGCKSPGPCEYADAKCTADNMNTTCYSRCEGYVGVEMCKGDSICLWDAARGVCAMDGCAVNELQSDCRGFSACHWEEGAKGGNGDGLCLSLSHSYPPPKSAATQLGLAQCYVLPTGETVDFAGPNGLCQGNSGDSIITGPQAVDGRTLQGSWSWGKAIGIQSARSDGLCLLDGLFNSVHDIPDEPPADDLDCSNGLGWTPTAQGNDTWEYPYLTDAYGVPFSFVGARNTSYTLYADAEGMFVMGAQDTCERAMCFVHLRIFSGRRFIDVGVGDDGLVVDIEEQCQPVAEPSPDWAVIRKRTAAQLVVDLISVSSWEKVRFAVTTRKVNKTTALAVNVALRTAKEIQGLGGMLFSNGAKWRSVRSAMPIGAVALGDDLVGLGRDVSCQCHRGYEEEYGYCKTGPPGGVPALMKLPLLNDDRKGLRNRGMYVKTTGAMYKVYVVDSDVLRQGTTIELETVVIGPTPVPTPSPPVYATLFSPPRYLEVDGAVPEQNDGDGSGDSGKLLVLVLIISGGILAVLGMFAYYYRYKTKTGTPYYPTSSNGHDDLAGF